MASRGEEASAGSGDQPLRPSVHHHLVPQAPEVTSGVPWPRILALRI